MSTRLTSPEADPVAGPAVEAIQAILNGATLAKYATAGTFSRAQAIDMTGQTGTALSLTAGVNLATLLLNAHGQALGITQDQDWSNYSTGPHDAIDGYYSGTGDFIFAGHFGGVLPASFTFTATTTSGSMNLSGLSSLAGLTKGTPLAGAGIPAGTRLAANASGTTATMDTPATASGSITVTVTRPTGSAGGNAIFNGLIPQYLDALGDGRTGGTILNNRTGMRGILLDGQVAGNTAPLVELRNHGGAAAIYIENQQPGSGFAIGTGRAFQVEGYNPSGSPVLLNIYNQLTAGQGYSVLDLRAKWTNAGSSAPSNMAQVVDQNGVIRWSIDSKGATLFNDGTNSRLIIDPTASPPVSFKDATNHLRWTLDTNGAQFFYNVSGQQVGAFSGQANTDGYFIFGRTGGASVVGFHGATPVAVQTITGSRGGNAALADLLTKLATKGLIVDGTTA